MAKGVQVENRRERCPRRSRALSSVMMNTGEPLLEWEEPGWT
jgi:hypothetical protein